jgi:hypothetical protein
MEVIEMTVAAIGMTVVAIVMIEVGIVAAIEMIVVMVVSADIVAAVAVIVIIEVSTGRDVVASNKNKVADLQSLLLAQLMKILPKDLLNSQRKNVPSTKAVHVSDGKENPC